MKSQYRSNRVIFKLCRFYRQEKKERERLYPLYIGQYLYSTSPHPSPLTPTYIEYKYS